MPLRFVILFLFCFLASQSPPANASDFKEGLKAVKSADWDKARAIFEELATHNHAGALYSLGLMYQRGRGVEKDSSKAIHYYELSARAGSANALNNMGVMYQRGDGIPVDYVKARELFARAAETHTMAKYNLGLLYEEGLGGERDFSKSTPLFEACAMEGAPPCMYRYARALEAGRGVEKNLELAEKFFIQAASHDYALAKRKVRLYEERRDREKKAADGKK